MMKSEKYQQDKVVIKIRVVYWILFILKRKKNRLIAADFSKQKAVDADSRAIQQIICAGVMIYYILEKSK